MTILDLLARMVGPAESLVALLEMAGAESPELKPQTDAWIAKLRAAVAHTSLVELAKVLPGEAQDILQGRINPKQHPSDAA